MKRLFELVTPLEWKDAHARMHEHLDISQAFEHLREQKEDSVRIKIPEGMKAETKRHVVLEYARRRKLELETMVQDGYIYIRIRSADGAKRGPQRGEHA
jgi:hypothetical protein